MKVEDAAAQCGFAIWTVRRMAREGLFAATKPRGNRGGWEIDDESFHAWMEGNRTQRGNTAYQGAMRGALAALALGLILPALGGCQAYDAYDAYDAYNAAYERELRAEVGTDGKRVVWAIRPRERTRFSPPALPASSRQTVNLHQRPQEVPPWAP